MRLSLSRWVAAILASLTLFMVSGCQEAFPVELRGVVRNAKDGSALPGVKVVLAPDAFTRSDGEVFPVVSGEDGTFRASFEMLDGEFGSGRSWSLSLAKEGFQEETVDLGAFEMPKSSGSTRIVVSVTLREKQ